MQGKKGMTLMEIIVVLLIVAVTAVVAFPSFTGPTEQARASNARNNLLAIYTAEQNYSNNHANTFCIDILPNPQPPCAVAANATCAQDLASINCNLSLNIQDDGTYRYACGADPSGFVCKATRTAGGNPVLTLTNAPVVLNGNGVLNPTCTPAGFNSCP